MYFGADLASRLVNVGDSSFFSAWVVLKIASLLSALTVEVWFTRTIFSGFFLGGVCDVVVDRDGMYSYVSGSGLFCAVSLWIGLFSVVLQCILGYRMILEPYQRGRVRIFPHPACQDSHLDSFAELCTH